MPSISNSKLKLLYLMKIFLEETDEAHDLSAAELLARLEAYGYRAERKSLYDDIETLRSFGMDIVMKKSKSFSYFLAQREFQLPELRLLVDAVQSSRFITHRKSSELIRKVETLCSRFQAADLQRQVYVTNRIKTMNESIYYNIDAIHAAISENRQITFKYFEWAIDHSAPGHFVRRERHGGALYHISPWALIWDDENYYMLGFDSAAGIMKHFRVDKMSSIKVASAVREGEALMKNFDVGDYTARLFGMFNGEPEHVKLRFANRLIGVVIDRYGKDIRISKEDDDHFGVILKVANSPQFVAWLFSFGDEVRVEYPQHVADELCAHAKAVQAVYKTEEG
jgi:predicted DNA-binding transcriptional regulator YafY